MDASFPYDRTERVGGRETELLLDVTDRVLLTNGCNLFRYRDRALLRTFDDIKDGVNA